MDQPGTQLRMNHTTHLSVIAWLQDQLAAQGLSIADLAARATLPQRLLREALEAPNAGRDCLTVRQTFTLADALGTDPADLITELSMLSERGETYLPYCLDASEAPLGELWSMARGLPEEDRTVLLECVLHRRRRQWKTPSETK